jgi:hypothetical protein
MNISSVSGGSYSAPARGPEKAEGPGPDHDGDADDKGAAGKSVAAAPKVNVQVKGATYL